MASIATGTEQRLRVTLDHGRARDQQRAFGRAPDLELKESFASALELRDLSLRFSTSST
jgi:hypothetical protein